jgi:hypothetical protein
MEAMRGMVPIKERRRRRPTIGDLPESASDLSHEHNEKD